MSMEAHSTEVTAQGPRQKSESSTREPIKLLSQTTRLTLQALRITSATRTTSKATPGARGAGECHSLDVMTISTELATNTKVRNNNMAKIELIGWIEEVKSSWLLRISEPHSKQENGTWITQARTYRDVKPAFDSSLNFEQFAKGDRVKVVGIEKTEVREVEGVTYRNLVVRADLVERVESHASSTAEPGAGEKDLWPSFAPSSDKPF